MEFNVYQTKPEATWKFLIHQVEEQSHLCDVTIKVGHWEKRFHRCVLIKSPFFDCVFKHDYKETHTGKIEIKLGSPVTVEMAIMFLYGKKPKLTSENVKIMMTLAEYFFIPNLKAACVAWLENVEVTDENCLKLLQVSSLFDIEIPQCTEFVEGHLDSLFENEQFTEIDSDSVKYIFTERKFSYISMDDRLKFLIRWTKVDTVKRCDRANEFVEHLNFQDISLEVLKEVSNNPMYRKLTAKMMAAKATSDTSNRHEVLIMKKERFGFWCLDLTRNRWFGLETVIFDNQTRLEWFDFLGVHTESTVYYTRRTTSAYNIVFFDLETCLFQTFHVVNDEGGEPLEGEHKINTMYAMYADVCIIAENDYLTYKWTSKNGYELDLSVRTSIVLAGFVPREQLFMFGRHKNKRIYIQTANIYIGRAVNDRIETKPLFTLLKGRVSKLCMGNASCFAFILKSINRLIIYDLSDYKMDIVEETTTDDDQLCSAENGFVIFNKKRCLYLQKLQGSATETMYRKNIIEFTDSGKKYTDMQMFFCKDRWYRYFKRSYKDNYQFECIAHSEILAAEHDDEIAWTPLPLPLEASKCRNDTLKQIYYVRLPKSKLRCDIECPHCEQLKKAKSKSRTVYNT